MRMRTQRILAALLSLVLLLALAPAGWAVNLDAKNTVKVSLVSQTDYAADIVNANITVDFYLIANAVPVTGYDTYALTVNSPYSALTLSDKDEDGTPLTLTLQQGLDKQVNAEAPNFDEIVEVLSKAVLENENSPSPSPATMDTTDKSTITASNLAAGMYLMVPHGAMTEGTDITTKTGETGYVKTVKIGEGEAAETVYRTRAYSDDYEYTFKPQLVTVPGKEIKGEDGTTPTYRTDEGTWTDVVSVNVKVERETRFGDLKIVKTLNTFAGPDPASFVFKITWDDQVRYAEVTFEEGGTKEYTLEKKIPVGTRVTVTEEHTGLQYSGSATSDTTVEILASDAQGAPAAVSFENNHTGPGGGYGAVNRFTASGTGAFEMEQIPDSGSEAPSSGNQTATEGEE